MSEAQDQPQPQQKHAEDEQFSIAIVPEATAIEEEPTPIPESSNKGPSSATAGTSVSTAKPSRLSMAFNKISCGLCFHPLKNNSGVDYHQLVHTPTDEEEPFFGQDSDHPNSNVEGTIVVPRDIMQDSKKESMVDHPHHTLEASSSATHAERSHLESKERTQVQEQEQGVPVIIQENSVIPTFVEEFTVDEDPVEAAEEVTSLNRDVAEEPSIQTAPATLAVVQAQEESAVSSPRAIASNVVTPLASPASSPARGRAAGAFAKLTKRSSPSATPTPTSTSSSPTSSTTSSPLLGRLGRFAKVIRPSDTTTSSFQTSSSTLSAPSQKVVESLEVASRRTSGQVHVQATSRVVSDERSLPVGFDRKNEEPLVQWSHSTPPLPPAPAQQQQQQPHQASQVNKRHSMVLDTAASFLNSSSTSPVQIPGQSPIQPWTTHSPTLHQNDASIASQVTHTGSGSINSTRSLSRVGRASTQESTLDGAPGSDVGSLSSSTKEGSASNSQGGSEGFLSKTTNRRKSVMKKLGKIINNINTKEGKEAKASKRNSRQGSMTLESPLAMSPTE